MNMQRIELARVERETRCEEARVEREARLEEARVERAVERAHQQQEEWEGRMVWMMEVVYPPPLQVEAGPLAHHIPGLMFQKFIEGVDDMGAYLQIFEATSLAGDWPRAQWSVYLRSSLSGQCLVAVATLRAADQGDYEVVKRALLATYHISSETYRKKVFDQHLTRIIQMPGFACKSSHMCNG